MKKKLLTLIISGVMAFSITACGGSGDSDKASDQNEDASVEQEEAKEVTYQSILDEYSQKIADATPGLVEEYNSESQSISTDINALAELSNEKIEKLAEISNEGIEKMAELMNENGDEYETYEEWSLKLTDVYTEYSTQITDAYTESVSGMSADDMMESLESLQ